MTENVAQRMLNVQTAIETLKICQNDAPYQVTKHFGFLKFDGNPIRPDTRLSQYIRLGLETDAEKVVKFMLQGWNLPKPDLIISVTGGAKNCDMSARLRKIFQSGLVSAALTTNAWLITAGTNAGVVKEVGEALSNYRYKNRKHGFDVPCIGIGSWGYTASNELLADNPVCAYPNGVYEKSANSFTHSQNEMILPMSTDASMPCAIRNYVVKGKQKKTCDLEPNHTHFLLFDDGQYKADAVLPLRAEIETCSRRINTENLAEDTCESLIPIVMVLVEGGPSSIRTVCKALDSNTPVVVVKESGRAADLVAELHACYSDGETNNTNGNPMRPQTSHPKTSSKEAEINAILTQARDDISGLEEVQKDLCRVLSERKKLITIFKFDSTRHHGNLEDAILESLFNAAKFSGDNNEQHRRVTELKLAIAWHKFNYAQKNLLTDKTISKWKEDDLRHALVNSLHRGHVDFVELLIEFGTPLDKLTNGDLKQLYATTSYVNRLPLKGKKDGIKWTRDDFYSDYFRSILDNQSKQSNLLTLDESKTLGKTAPQELFLWAVFLDRFELATYLCSKSLNRSVAPLFASHIYRRAARLTMDPDTQQQYEAHADQFDVHAMSIIDRCFDNDENFAVDLVKNEAVAFNNIAPLILARHADCRTFLASKCVQRYLDNQWFGYINYKRTLINFRVFLCSLFLPLIPIFCLFLPYVQKHKNIVTTSRDGSKVTPANMVQNSHEQTARPKKIRIPWITKIKYFYQAPIVRFYYYTIFFITFLILFSFVLLVDYFPLNKYGEKRSGIQDLRLPITETILHICIWSLIVEEIRQFVSIGTKREYISEVWNIIDICAIIIYIIAFITRFIVLEALFVISKIFLSIDLIIWFVRTLHLFSAFEKLGPKLLMIFNTLKDMLFFVCFILIFLLAFSISSWALITTNNQVSWNYNSDGSLYNATVTGSGSGLWNWYILRNVTNYGVWKIFGQVDSIDGTDAYSIVAFILAILFVAIANVLLLNVLVALFNVTIQDVANQSHRLWRYQRFSLVATYSTRPLLPPPFNSIYYLFALGQYIFRKIQSFRQQSPSVAKQSSAMESINLNENTVEEQFTITDSMQREIAIADDYWSYTLKQEKKEPIETAIKNIERKLHELQERVHHIGSLSSISDQQAFLIDE